MSTLCEMKGTEWECEHDGRSTSPIRRGIIEINGVVLQFAVYPERTSLSGNVYHPMRLRYKDGQNVRLVPESTGL